MGGDKWEGEQIFYHPTYPPPSRGRNYTVILKQNYTKERRKKMGVLTNDMTRLRDDIDALHNSRGAFIMT